MAMEIETFEFTIEDILSMHRWWISKLFIDDKKSEVEIMELLSERRLVATCAPPFSNEPWHCPLTV